MVSAVVESETLLNARLGFLDTRVALIHVPLHVYPLLVHPILGLLLHDPHSGEDEQRPWMFQHPFVNISITGNECSIVCPRRQAEELFQPVMDLLPKSVSDEVSISKEDYSVIAVGGEGLEAGQRVLDLTSPLAGISIFFITSYSMDFLLVPVAARSMVIGALEDRGFIFEAEENGDAGYMVNPASPLLPSHPRSGSMSSSLELPVSAGTPPPTTVPELQKRTFKLLLQNGIRPTTDPNLELVTCSGVRDNTASMSAMNFTEGKLQLGLTKCLTMTPPPRFMSVTLTQSESPSITLEKHLTSLFHNDGEDLLLGRDGPEQVAITLDLQELPHESTGIVCGIASRLSDSMRGRIGDVLNISYLSTAKAGHVIVYLDELNAVMASLGDLELNGSARD